MEKHQSLNTDIFAEQEKCNTTSTIHQIMKGTHRMIWILVTLNNKQCLVLVDITASNNFVPVKIIHRSKIRPANQVIQLATHQNTGKAIGDMIVTVRIRDVETITIALVSADLRDDALLGIP
ncbi:hypothetical protein PR048_029693 [Dryococelus australis]|uniref:Uncharacterized protein n=1 Tax=Dryococelus australis TaxID=614101 RepID=A0ABQ9GE27_9NEOP|nr:hypothetical protein PR048_029693 [Dryococelus australis]